VPLTDEMPRTLNSSRPRYLARKPENPIAAEAIARLAERGKDVSFHFTNRGRMMEPLCGPIRRVNVDFTAEMLQELDSAAGQLNISRAGRGQGLTPAGAGPAVSGGKSPAKSRLSAECTHPIGNRKSATPAIALVRRRQSGRTGKAMRIDY
jgi:hypothetical protein